MKKSKILISLLLVVILLSFTVRCNSQTIGKTSTEQYKASFETKTDISQYNRKK